MIATISLTICTSGLATAFVLGCGCVRGWLERDETRRRNGW